MKTIEEELNNISFKVDMNLEYIYKNFMKHIKETKTRPNDIEVSLIERYYCDIGTYFYIMLSWSYGKKDIKYFNITTDYIFGYNENKDEIIPLKEFWSELDFNDLYDLDYIKNNHRTKSLKPTLDKWHKVKSCTGNKLNLKDSTFLNELDLAQKENENE